MSVWSISRTSSRTASSLTVWNFLACQESGAKSTGFFFWEIAERGMATFWVLELLPGFWSAPRILE